MFCKKCGAELRLNAKFCAKCGTPAPVKPAASVTPAARVAPADPPEEVKTLLKRDEPPKVIHVPPTETAPAPEKLIINMAETSASSSNGQFNEWFTEPGDLD